MTERTPARMLAAQSEDEFRRAVQEYAALRGWIYWHQRPARVKDGWRSAGEGHKGFFDNTFARNGVVLFVEFKSQKGKLSEGQRVWLGAIGQVPPGDVDELFRSHDDRVYAAVWRPADWPHIERMLT